MSDHLDGAPATIPAPTILFICTANQCRSPMAEALATTWVQQHGVVAGISSAGVLPGDVPVQPGAVRARRRRGIDWSAHRSRQISPAYLEWAQLIVTMERTHLMHLAEISPAVVDRSFPLRELDALVALVGPRRSDESLLAWSHRASAARLPGAVVHYGTDDDVADPMGKGNRAFRRTAEELEALIGRVLTAALPPGS
jgi:protein-tyrosine phosphatase